MTAHARAPWQGTLRLTSAQRAALRVGPITDALIDAVLPTVEYIAYWRRHGHDGKIDTSTRRRWAHEVRSEAAAVEAFAALWLRQDPPSPVRVFVAGWLVEHGIPARKALSESDALAEELRELARRLRSYADEVRPRPGTGRDEHASHLVSTAAECWRNHTGRRPTVSATGPFVGFCAALGALAGIELERDKVRHLLDRAN
jgi:hypothetical protein